MDKSVLVDRDAGRAFIMVPGTRSGDLSVKVHSVAKNVEWRSLADTAELRAAGDIETVYAIIRNPRDRWVGWVQRNIRDSKAIKPLLRQLGVTSGTGTEQLIAVTRQLVGSDQCPPGLRPQTSFWKLPDSPGYLPDKIVPFELLPDYVRTELRDYPPMEPYAWPGGQYKTATIFLRGQAYEDVGKLYQEDLVVYRRETKVPRVRDFAEQAQRKAEWNQLQVR